jgi:hypothetical protein
MVKRALIVEKEDYSNIPVQTGHIFKGGYNVFQGRACLVF